MSEPKHTLTIPLRFANVSVTQYAWREVIVDFKTGETVNCRVPVAWSDNAATTLMSKYAVRAGVSDDKGGVNGREVDAERIFDRLCAGWGAAAIEHGYWDCKNGHYWTFIAEIKKMLEQQRVAPNSPQWFNTGVAVQYGIEAGSDGHYFATVDEYGTATAQPCDDSLTHPQISACFIQSVDDKLVGEGGIMDLWQREARLFKYGSGSGANYSRLRGKGEGLSRGGASSGLLSFLRVGDRSAGAIKSGGTTRRSARMVIVDIDHPDIEEFIGWKAGEDDKIRALHAAGYGNPSSYEDEATETVSGQNANNSVAVTDAFMQAVEDDDTWELLNRVDGSGAKSVNARELWDQIAEAAWKCGDPGLQFSDTINRWHTCKSDGPIRSSNPCCIRGDMFVDTSEGRVRIDDLAQRFEQGLDLPHVWCFDTATAMPALKPCTRAWKSGESRELVEVVTDKGIKVVCTPEHRFLLRSGSYVQAKDLQVGQRLRKVARSVNRHRSHRRMLSFVPTTRHPNGHQYQSIYMWEQVHGQVPKGYQVHHVNGDATDDRLSNLELVEKRAHCKAHSQGLANPRAIDVSVETLVEVWEAVEQLPPGARGVKSRRGHMNPSRWNLYVREAGLEGSVPLARGDGRIRGQSWDEFTAWIDEHRGAVNDKVLSVRHYTTEPTAVYDIEVEGCHNFGVSHSENTGEHTIVVHNSEYVFLDDTACNLASINLAKFYAPDRTDKRCFDWDGYAHAVRLWTIVLDISVSMAGYPTAEIAKRSMLYRTLGLGYAALGELLVQLELGYGMPEGRAFAAELTSFMTAVAYKTSTELARRLGTFPCYRPNRGHVLDVVEMHMTHATLKTPRLKTLWGNVFDDVVKHGVRNAQVTLLAPTGTIGIVMDCETTGVEPLYSDTQFKSLAGGGVMRLVASGFDKVMRKHGHDPAEFTRTVFTSEDRVREYVWLEPPTELADVLVCASDLTPQQHIDMMAAVQPFLSGAISKTINMPGDATIDDVARMYDYAWRQGLKSIAIYRDGCKPAQPLQGRKPAEGVTRYATRDEAVSACLGVPVRESGTKREQQRQLAETVRGWIDECENLGRGERHEPPTTSNMIKHRVDLSGHTFYLMLGEHADGSLAEVFVICPRTGSAMSGWVNAWSKIFSLALQHGTPLDVLVSAMSGETFDPAGYHEGRPTTSPVDAFARIIEARYLASDRDGLGSFVDTLAAHIADAPSSKTKDASAVVPDSRPTGQSCSTCGGMTLVRSGSCFVCRACGTTTGCS